MSNAGSRRLTEIVVETPLVEMADTAVQAGGEDGFLIRLAVAEARIVVAGPARPTGLVLVGGAAAARVTLSTSEPWDVEVDGGGEPVDVVCETAVGRLFPVGRVGIRAAAPVAHLDGQRIARLSVSGRIVCTEATFGDVRRVAVAGVHDGVPAPALEFHRLASGASLVLDGLELVVGRASSERSPVRLAGVGTVSVAGEAPPLVLESRDLGVVVEKGSRVVAEGVCGELALGGDASVVVSRRRAAIEPGAVACGAEAEILGLRPYRLGPSSIEAIGSARRISFHLEPSRRRHLTRAIEEPVGVGPVAVSGSASWRWRQLVTVATASADDPLVRVRCAEAEMEARRREATGTKRLALEGYRLLGYGLRPIRPWLAHAVLCAILATVVAVSADTGTRTDLIRLAQLLLAGLGVLRIDALKLSQTPGVWDTMAAVTAGLSGLAALTSSVLSLRPFLSRP